MTKLSLLVTSDTHGYWLEEPDGSSLLQTATTIEQLTQKSDHDYLLIDLGDFIQGSSFASYLYQEEQSGLVLAQAMNEIGYHYQVLGNHEFNFGPSYRDQVLNALNAKILNTNLIDQQTQEPFVGVPYAIHTFGDLKIGLIGATTHYIPHWELAEHIQGLEFKDAATTIGHYVRQLRPQVDLLVVLYHGGFERDLETGEWLTAPTGENQGFQILEDCPEIDVFLTGHQHRCLNQQVGNTWVIQPGSRGDYVGEVAIEFDGQKIKTMTGYLHSTTSASKSQKLLEVLEPEYTDGSNWLDQEIGFAPLESPTDDPFEARIDGHPFVELLNQIQQDYFKTSISSVALVNDYFSQFTGPITQELLLQTYPYYNRLALVSLMGQDLYAAIEHNMNYFQLDQTGSIEVNPAYLHPKSQHYHYDLYSGLTMTIDLTQPPGSRVIKLVEAATGEAIDFDQTYQVAMTHYRASGGGDFSMFNSQMIETVSTVDLATLLRQAISPQSTIDWERINTNYTHVRWVTDESNNRKEDS